jgi:hypothetical protein
MIAISPEFHRALRMCARWGIEAVEAFVVDASPRGHYPRRKR